MTRSRIDCRLLWIAIALCLAFAGPLYGQSMAPLYEECRLDSIFPNGAKRGTSVAVELRGFGAGLTDPTEIVIDGPDGIAVKDLKAINGSTVTAMLEIAPDAPLGRRWLRLASERSGLTNFTQFVVSDLPEQLEAEPNNDLSTATAATADKLVINGRVNPAGDIDCFRITAKAGDRFVAAIAAHTLDVHGQGRNYGNADFGLELLDANGRVLASAEDTLGFDPLIEHVIPADGPYVVRVQLLNYGGFPEAIYRLTLGAVAYPTAVFPPGGRIGEAVEFTFVGPNVDTAARTWDWQTWGLQPLGSKPRAFDAELVRYLTANDNGPTGVDLPVVIGRHRESIEIEPNDASSQATQLPWPCCVNGRFDSAGDADWYAIELKAQRKVWLETTAQRFIRSPVDTLIQVFDRDGKLLGENDDEAFDPGYESYHDFKTTDSKLLFSAPSDGLFFVKVTEQTGTAGPRAIYRLTVEEATPDFRVTHFPDAVPVWGPGSTAAMLVRVDRFAGCDDDIELSVEGLPPGWTSSSAKSLGGKGIRPYNTYQHKVFVTVTAPADAKPGTHFPFRIVGKSMPDKSEVMPVERTGIPLNLYYTSDTGYFRASHVARVAVAKSQGPWLERIDEEVTIPAGGEGTIKVRVVGFGEEKTMPLVVNVAAAGVACALTTPQQLSIDNGVVTVPIKLPPEIFPGTYHITVAQTWRSDIRIGMPGPCTPLIRLVVPPKQ